MKKTRRPIGRRGVVLGKQNHNESNARGHNSPSDAGGRSHRVPTDPGVRGHFHARLLSPRRTLLATISKRQHYHFHQARGEALWR